MIDIHNHLLHGLDDGAETLEESVEMCRISFNDGVRIIVATPHTLNYVYENSRATILAKVQELNGILIPKVFPPAIPSPTNHENLKIIPGADVFFSEELLSEHNREKITTVADGGKFLLLEFPSWGIPPHAEAVLFQLLVRKITPNRQQIRQIF